MGAAVVKAVYENSELELVGAIDKNQVGVDAGVIAGIGSIGVAINETLSSAAMADVVVDFTHPSVVEQNVNEILNRGMHAVVGTTGLTEAQLEKIEQKSKETGFNVFVAPNFAIGAVLMMELSKKAAKYMDNVEIIELHHDQKVDAPSGTALKTGQELKEITGKNVPIHSVRLPGLVAHQEVLFGAKGQTLSIRHDSLDRTSFMPGVVKAVKTVPTLKGLTVGLEKLIEI
jgi:4-hydroxy-tetrahydrodipicolinate reductase